MPLKQGTSKRMDTERQTRAKNLITNSTYISRPKTIG